MNRYALLILLLMSLIQLHAQDKIVLTNGETLSAKVVELSPQEIKYKRYNHLEGPTIVIEREKVFVIIYENGSSEVITPKASSGRDVPTSREEAEKPVPSTKPAPPTEPAISKTEPGRPTNTSIRVTNDRYRDDYDANDILVLGGFATIPEDGQIGGYIGIETTRYFTKGVGVVSHISAIYIAPYYGYFYTDPEYVKIPFLLGMKVRTPARGFSPYASILLGVSWSSLESEYVSAWAYELGGSAGFIIINKIDVGARYTFDPENEVSTLLAGVGFHF